MKRTVPTAFVAVRPIRLGGVLYDAGDTIPNAAVTAVRNPNSLISRGWIKATPSQLPQRRGGSRFRQPTYYSPRELAAINVGG